MSIRKCACIFIIFVCSMQCVWAVRYQFFLGIGQSIGNGILHTNATNQMTKNTSSVNASGGYYYSQMQLGDYNGSVKDITSGYIGGEVTFDEMGIFTLRGYINASYSNKVNFGNISNLHDGNLRKCNQDEMPNLTNICYRDGFYVSGLPKPPKPDSNSNFNGQYHEIKFNKNPGFANTLSNSAFMLDYGIGVDFGFNIPIHILVATFSDYRKMIPLRVGVYGGIGYDFVTYSLGHYDGRTYNNTTTGTNGVQGVALNTRDTLYFAGAGAFARFGASMYAYNNIRFDIGVKMPIMLAGDPSAKSQRWYQVGSTQNLNGIDEVFAQQLLRQEHNTTLGMYWQFAINVLFN